MTSTPTPPSTSVRPLGILTALGALLVASCGGTSLPPAAERVDTAVTTPSTEAPDARTAPDATDRSTPSEDPEPTDDGPSATEPTDVGVSVTATGTWTDVTTNLVGLDSTCGNVSFVSAHPRTSQVIAGIAANGLWQLTEDSAGWNPIGVGAGIDHRTAWIEYDPDDANRYWVSGAYGEFGGFRTDDGGATFERLGDASHVDVISVDFTDPGRLTMLMGKHEQRIVLLSRDGGASWVDIATSLPDDAGFTSAPHVIDADTFLVGSYNGDSAGIHRTADAGATWTQVFAGGAIGAPVVDGDSIVWATSSGELAVSDDGGRSFERSAGSSGGRSASLVPLPNGALVAVGAESLAVTTDRGDTWSPVGPELPFRPFGIAFSAARSAFYAWTFTCNFGVDGDPVLEKSIVELSVDVVVD